MSKILPIQLSSVNLLYKSLTTKKYKNMAGMVKYQNFIRRTGLNVNSIEAVKNDMFKIDGETPKIIVKISTNLDELYVIQNKNKYHIVLDYKLCLDGDVVRDMFYDMDFKSLGKKVVELLG